MVAILFDLIIEQEPIISIRVFTLVLFIMCPPASADEAPAATELVSIVERRTTVAKQRLIYEILSSAFIELRPGFGTQFRILE